MLIDPSLRDASPDFEFDDASALNDYARSPQKDFDEWYSGMEGKTFRQRADMIMGRLSNYLSPEDMDAIREMLALLERNEKNGRKENTDIEYITKRLQEKNKDVNEIAVLRFYIILNAAGLIGSEK